MYNRTLFLGTDITVLLFAKWAAQNILTNKDVQVIAKLFLSAYQYFALKLEVCKYAKIYLKNIYFINFR